MNTINESSTDGKIEGEREVIRQALDDIAVEVGVRLREAGLNVQVFLTVPRTGNALATFATPADPKEDVWKSVCEIVRQIVSGRLNRMKLQSQELPCAMANTAMSAAGLIGD